MSRFIDIHVLQTLPPGNINRDDTGSPKTAVYGGVRRARVSSQAWKRATRTAFGPLLDASSLGVRTKRVVELVAEAAQAASPALAPEAARAAAETVLGEKGAGLKLATPQRKNRDQSAPEPAKESSYLVFLSRKQVAALAALAVTVAGGGVLDKKAARSAADTDHSVDVALFGRMVADATNYNVDAAAQVAHALGVHASETEFDYFTAVDDRNQADEPGAGMIGTVEFTSSTVYRYATVDVDNLRKNLAGTDGDVDATAPAAEAFLRAFITSMPTGKQNTFAHRTLPDAVVVQARSAQPVNLVGAFEDAVEAEGGRSRLRVAAERLARHAEEVDAAYGTAPDAAWVLQVGSATAPLSALGEAVSLESLVTAVGEHVRAGREPSASSVGA